MAKQTTTCARCDGTFDGTPSGWLKHQRSNKHNTAKPMTGDGIPEGFPDAFAVPGAAVPVSDGEKDPVAVAKGKIARGEVAALNDPGDDTDGVRPSALEGDEPSFQPVAEPTDEELAAIPETEPVAKPAKPKVTKVKAEVYTKPVEPVAEPEPVQVPDFNPEDLDERPDSLLIAEFRPFDYPERTPEVQQIAVELLAEAEAALAAVAKGKRYVRHGELHNLKLLPKYQEQLAEATERVAEVERVKAAIETNDEQRFAAHYERVAAYWTRVHEAVVAELEDSALFPIAPDSLKLNVDVVSPQVEIGFVRFNGPRGVWAEGSEERTIEPGRVTISDRSGEALRDVPPTAAAGIGVAIQAVGLYGEAFNRVVGL